MGKLTRKYACCLAFAVFCLSTAALADQLTYLGSTTGSAIGPYNMQLNGADTTMICDSGDLYVGPNESWQATGVSVGSMTSSNMPTQVYDLFDGGTNANSSLTVAGMITLYQESAWLALQMSNPANSDSTTQAEIQEAIWYVTSGSGNGNYGGWVTAAQNAVAAAANGTGPAIDYNDVIVYTYSGWTPGGTISVQNPRTDEPLQDQPQEFLDVVPEPPTAALAGISLVGMLGLMVFYRRRTVFGNSN